MSEMFFGEGSVFYENGYGMVAKKVMLDKELSIESKSIYSFIMSFAGTEDEAYPTVDFICDHLKITRKRFYNHIEPLIKRGYIKRIKNKDKETGRFYNNIYKINYMMEDIENQKSYYDRIEEEKSPCTHHPTTDNPTTDKRYTDNEHTTNNNCTSNNFISNNLKNKKEGANKICPLRLSDIKHQLDPEEYEVISHYFMRYYFIIGEKHPGLLPEKWAEIRESLFTAYDDNIGRGYDLDVDDLKQMIDRHFQVKYKNCDYNIIHFCQDNVKVRRMYETIGA